MLGKRNKISILSDLNHKSFLIPVFFLVGIFNHIEQSTLLDRQKDLLKRDPSLPNQFVILGDIPTVEAHKGSISHCVPFGYNAAQKRGYAKTRTVVPRSSLIVIRRTFWLRSRSTVRVGM